MQISVWVFFVVEGSIVGGEKCLVSHVDGASGLFAVNEWWRRWKAVCADGDLVDETCGGNLFEYRELFFCRFR